MVYLKSGRVRCLCLKAKVRGRWRWSRSAHMQTSPAGLWRDESSGLQHDRAHASPRSWFSTYLFRPAKYSAHDFPSLALALLRLPRPIRCQVSHTRFPSLICCCLVLPDHLANQEKQIHVFWSRILLLIGRGTTLNNHVDSSLKINPRLTHTHVHTLMKQ